MVVIPLRRYGDRAKSWSTILQYSFSGSDVSSSTHSLFLVNIRLIGIRIDRVDIQFVMNYVFYVSNVALVLLDMVPTHSYPHG